MHEYVSIIFKVLLMRYFCSCVQKRYLREVKMMDKSWIDLPNKMSREYINGIDQFLVFAYTNRAEGSMISCPCRKCENRYHLVREGVWEHLMLNGFFKKSIDIELIMGNPTYLCMVSKRMKHWLI